MAPSSLEVSILNSTSGLLAVLDLNEQQKQMQNMKEMDIDQIMDVPDTPDRLAAWKTSGGEDNEKEVNSLAANDFGNSNILDKGVLNRLRSSGRGNNGRLYSHPGKELSICDETEQGSSSSVLKNAQLFRRMIADKTSKCDTKHSAQPQQPDHVTSSSSLNGGSNYLVQRAKLNRDSCGIAELLDSDVKMRDGTSDEMIDLISSKKIPSSSTYSPNGRNTRRKTLQGNTKYDKGKAICTEVSSRSFTCEDENSIMDLTVQNKHTAGVPERARPVYASKDFVGKEMRRGSMAANSCLSLHNIANSSNASSNACKGKTKTDHDTYNGADASLDCGKGFGLSSDSHPKTEQILSRSLHSITSPRNTGQKRLVRNGCISPYNISKAKQSAEIHGNSYTDGKQDDIDKVVSGGPSCLIDIVSPNSDDNLHYDKVKEKGVMHYPYSSKEHDAKTVHLLSSSPNPTKEASGIRDASGDTSRSFGEICGWRSTRNRSKKISSPLSDEVGRISRRNDCVGYFLDQHRENGAENRDNVGEGNDIIETAFPEVQDPVPFQHGPASCSVQVSSIAMSQLDRKSGRNRGTNKLLKRQKEHSLAGSNHGESSTLASDDSGVAFLGSSGEPSNARSTRSRNPHRRGILGPVIEIDDLSPEIRCRMVDDDSDVKARQVEADEILARQLQEQLYHEFPGAGGGEIDASIAWTLQLGEDAQRNSRGGHRASHPRDPSMTHLYRQYPSRSFQNPSVRSGSRARIPNSTRMARLRSSYLSQSPTSSSRARSLRFPSNMDLDMRIHMLEALEAAVGNSSDVTTASHFFQAQRDFNENDYEMLLTLDEDNHHGGASLNQINGLPQSTVQTDNFEEACAICLETPTTGDTIRHLPCLHKFHKECIDPWLRRKTSCPVCKSCIT